MSTRGTVIFMENELENMEKLDIKDFENTQSIYIHSDMYPSGALPRIMEFLNIGGAKSRAFDTSYLGAWFVGYIVNDNTKYSLFWGNDETGQEMGFRYIKEIRANLTKGKKELKRLIEERKGKTFRTTVMPSEMMNILGLDTNKFMKECTDFTGVGLQIGLNDWCDYTYVIIPQRAEETTFDIYIYSGFRLLRIVNSSDIIENWEELNEF